MYQQGKLQRESAVFAGTFACLLALLKLVNVFVGAYSISTISGAVNLLYNLALVPLLALCAAVLFRQKKDNFALVIVSIGAGLELLYTGVSLLVMGPYSYYPDLTILALFVVAGWSFLPKNRNKTEPVAMVLAVGYAINIVLNVVRYIMNNPEIAQDGSYLFHSGLPQILTAGFLLTAGLSVGLKSGAQGGHQVQANLNTSATLHSGCAIAAGVVMAILTLNHLVGALLNIEDITVNFGLWTIYDLVWIPLMGMETAVFLRRKWDNFAMVTYICVVGSNLLMVLLSLVVFRDSWLGIFVVNVLLLWLALPQNRQKDKTAFLLVVSVFALETLLQIASEFIDGTYYMGNWHYDVGNILESGTLVLAAAAMTVGFRGVPQQPVYRQPVYQQPVYQQPVYQQPVYQQPVYQQPVYQQPVYQQPVYQQPVYQQPVYQQPVYQQPVYQQPVYQQPVYHQPVYQQPVQQPAYQQPAPQPEQPTEQTENP